MRQVYLSSKGGIIKVIELFDSPHQDGFNYFCFWILTNGIK